MITIGHISLEKALEQAKSSQKLAYIGRVGRARKDFCLGYIELKKKTYREALEKKQNELAGRGEKLTCEKGCVYCCYEFATADIRDCESIAYYVNQNDARLEKSVRALIEWQNNLTPHAELIAKIQRAQDKVIRRDPGMAATLQQYIIEYFNLCIPCPFLEDKSCLIYEVRPDVCFSQAATTPPEWCSFKTDKMPKQVQLLSQPIMPPFYYGRDPNLHTIEIMADTVFRLLTDGYRCLDKIPDLKGIYGEFIRDREVRAGAGGRKRRLGKAKLRKVFYK